MSDERDRLLAQKNAPSVTEREATFDAVMITLERTGQLGSRSRRGLWFGFAGAAAALAVAVIFLSQDDEFRARGEAGSRISVTCDPTCRTGATLHTDVSPPSSAPYFVVFSRGPDGMITWYSADVRYTDIVIDDKGEHVFYAVFSTAPLTRDEVKARFMDDGTPKDPALVATTRVRIE